MKVFIDEKKLAPADWSMPYGTLVIAGHVKPKYGATVRVEYEPGDPWYNPWKFGDILVNTFGDHFMFLTDKGLGPDIIWAMNLHTQQLRHVLRDRVQRVVE